MYSVQPDLPIHLPFIELRRSYLTGSLSLAKGSPHHRLAHWTERRSLGSKRMLLLILGLVHLGNVGRYVFAPVSCHRLVVLLRRYQCTKFTSEVLPQFVLGSQCTNLWILFCPHFFSGTVRRSGEQPKHLFTMNPISSRHSTRF